MTRGKQDPEETTRLLKVDEIMFAHECILGSRMTQARIKGVLYANPFNFKLILKILKAIYHLRFTRRTAQIMLFINSRKPITIKEKILYKMAYDRNPQLTLFADRVRVRKYVAERVGEGFLIQSHGVFHSLREINRTRLPRNFVIKASHGSGASVICWDGAPRGLELPIILKGITWEKFLIHPDDLNWNSLVSLSEKWKTLNYSWVFGQYPEWAYQDVNPQLIVEAIITQEGKIPKDFKFFMSNGECMFIQVDSERFSSHRRDIFSPSWTNLELIFKYAKSDDVIEKPKSFDLMLEISRKLSLGIDFVRVDLYESDEGIKFGELTNYPEGGSADLRPRESSIKFAESWVQQY